MTLVPTQIKAILIAKDTATAPSEGTPRQVTLGTITKGSGVDTVVIDGLEGLGTAVPWGILEAIDGDCLAQKFIIVAFDDATNTATLIPPFRTAAPTTKQALYRHWAWPKATATSDGSTTTAISALRTESSDVFADMQMLSAYGTNTDLEEISGFVPATDTFTFGAMAAATKTGDLLMPVQSLSPRGSKITIDGGKAIEREITGDTPAGEGVVVGAQGTIGIQITPEVKGLAAAAGNGTAAKAPNEIREALQALFTETLETGDTVGAGSTTTTVTCTTATRFLAGGIAMVNGDAFGISAASTTPTPDELTVPTGHIRTAPASADIIYGGACYQPKASGHSSCSFLAWVGRREFYALTGAMAKVGVKIEQDKIAHYDFDWAGIEGLRGTWTQPHYARLDAATPCVGKSNVSRIVLAGSELAADVLSVELNLLDAPLTPNAAFGAVENKGGRIYGSQNPGGKIVMRLEDPTMWNRYRALSEFDLLIQVGRIPTAAWAFWAPRAQIIASPEEGEESNLGTVTASLRFLPPSTQGRPAFTMAHF